MAWSSLARLAARGGLLAAGPQPSALPALAALQTLQTHLYALQAQLQLPAAQARGFAAAPGSGDGDGAKAAGTEPTTAQQVADEPQQRHEQHVQQQEEQQEDAAAKTAADEAAGSGGGGGGQGPSSGGSTAEEAGGTQAPPFSVGKENPELQKYIQQLKLLKGSTTVQKQQTGSEPTVLQSLLQATLGKWVQGWIGDFVRMRIEKEFDDKDFVEGAKDAVYTVHELLAEGDWEGLKPMMSAKLLSAWRDTAAEYRAEGFVWRTQLGAEPWSGGLRGMAFMSRAQMDLYDPSIASLAPEVPPLSAAPTGMFMVLTVSLRVEQLVTISREEDGKVVAELRDLRPSSWKFATGPLPGHLPVDQLHTPWFLLSI